MRSEPAVAVWCGVLAAALACDAYLIRRGHRSLSDVAGGSCVGRVLTVYLAAHLLHVGPRRYDPLAQAANLIRGSSVS